MFEFLLDDIDIPIVSSKLYNRLSFIKLVFINFSLPLQLINPQIRIKMYHIQLGHTEAVKSLLLVLSHSQVDNIVFVRQDHNLLQIGVVILLSKQVFL